MSFSKRLKNCLNEFIFIFFFSISFHFDKIFIELMNSMEKMNLMKIYVLEIKMKYSNVWYEFFNIFLQF